MADMGVVSRAIDKLPTWVHVILIVVAIATSVYYIAHYGLFSTIRIHSSRSRTKGSTNSARCAGIHVATSPSNAIANTTPANTSGSRGVA